MTVANIVEIINAHQVGGHIAHQLEVDATLIRAGHPVQASYNATIDGVPGTISILWQPVPEGAQFAAVAGAMPHASAGLGPAATPHAVPANAQNEGGTAGVSNPQAPGSYIGTPPMPGQASTGDVDPSEGVTYEGSETAPSQNTDVDGEHAQAQADFAAEGNPNLSYHDEQAQDNGGPDFKTP